METDILTLIHKAQAGDAAACDAAVEQNLGLVWSVVKRFTGRGCDADDLYQIGCMGLIKAVKRFDESYHVQFSTYAVPLIIGEMKKFLRDDGLVKVSRSLKETAQKAMGIRQAYMAEHDAEPPVSYLAAALGVDCEEVAMALCAAQPAQSIYQTMAEGDRAPVLLMDKLAAEGSPEEDVVNRLSVRQVLATFGERDQKIIEMRYFQNKTQAQIAAQLGISQVQVSRLEKAILMKMREKMSPCG